MIIPKQLPQIVTAARSGALQALALQAGQIVDARVVGPGLNGATQVQISGQLLNLILPQAAKAGETLRLEVQGSGAQLRLALQASSTTPLAPLLPSGPATQITTSAMVQTPANPAAPAAVMAAPTRAAQPAPTAPPPPGSATGVPTAQATGVPAAGQSASVLPVAAGPGSPPVIATASAAAPGAPVSVAPPGPATSPAVVPQAAAAVPPAALAQATAVAPPAAAVPRQAAPYAAATGNPATASVPANFAVNPATIVAAVQVAGTAPLAPLMPSTPQAALAQMVQTALPQQNSLVGLATALNTIAGRVALPEPVARAAQQILNNQINIGGGRLDGGTLQKAVLNSGVFQEAALMRPGTPLTPPQADMKAAMLALRQTLTSWLGQQTPVLPVSQIAPPLRGKIPRARALDIPPIDPASGAEEIGKHLLERTESALARMRLHQHASLPEVHVKTADWSTELPVVIGGHLALLQLQIHRDQHGAAEDPELRGWQMRFAINLPGLGEVGAQVSLRGSATGVMLWASERATSEALESDIEGLRGALEGAGLAPGAVIVRHGAPPAPQQPSDPGHLVDSSR